MHNYIYMHLKKSGLKNKIICVLTVLCFIIVYNSDISFIVMMITTTTKFL